MELNQDNNKRINDCNGSCKTPIGCTCSRSKKKQNINNQLVNQLDQAESVIEQGNVIDPAVLANYRPELPKTKSCCHKNTTCCPGSKKLEVYDWYSSIPQIALDTQMIEVQFKNTRKGYYLNSNNLELNKGDIVAVEALPGHDIGEITLTGKLVQLQMKKNNYRGEVKRIYRVAKSSDLEKAKEAHAKEHETMLRAREIAEDLQLAMKISDIEYQGDGNKAIFYYIADDRVDFRQLIKVYASEFKVKIEMKQIGARQEAGRVGGIGPCGRELCCSSSMSNFVSVSTSAARLQEIPLNPQKLAGQCGKLKCCLNFEVDTYVEAQRKLPRRDTVLETKDTAYFHFKTDILTGMMTYSTDKNFPANLITIPMDRVMGVININKRGGRPLSLASDEESKNDQMATSQDVLMSESITRFDNQNKNKRKNKKILKQQKAIAPNRIINEEVENTNSSEMNSNNKQQAGKKIFLHKKYNDTTVVMPESNESPNLTDGTSTSRGSSDKSNFYKNKNKKYKQTKNNNGIKDGKNEVQS